MADHRVKIKENKKSDKYLDFSSGLNIMEHQCDGDNIYDYFARNGSQGLDRVPGRVGNRRTNKTIQTTAFFFRSARILRSVLENWGGYLSPGLFWMTISKRWIKKLQGLLLLIIIIDHKFKIEQSKKTNKQSNR